jgi:FixJ family two-component response regulator
MDVPVLGGMDVLPELLSQGVNQAVNAVGGISNIHSRIQVFKRLSAAGFISLPWCIPRLLWNLAQCLPGFPVY